TVPALPASEDWLPVKASSPEPPADTLMVPVSVIDPLPEPATVKPDVLLIWIWPLVLVLDNVPSSLNVLPLTFMVTLLSDLTRTWAVILVEALLVVVVTAPPNRSSSPTPLPVRTTLSRLPAPGTIAIAPPAVVIFTTPPPG